MGQRLKAMRSDEHIKCEASVSDMAQDHGDSIRWRWRAKSTEKRQVI